MVWQELEKLRDINMDGEQPSQEPENIEEKIEVTTAGTEEAVVTMPAPEEDDDADDMDVISGKRLCRKKGIDWKHGSQFKSLGGIVRERS